MVTFQIKAHTTATQLHGDPYRFELPVFSETLPGISEKRGLYVSMTKYGDPDERAFLFIFGRTLELLMTGWPSGESAVLDFARQNIQEFRRLVLNIRSGALMHDGRPEEITFEGERYAIYEYAHPGEN